MKKSFIIIFLIIGLITGSLLTWQFLTEPPSTSNFPIDEIEARETLLKDFLDEQSYLQSRIVFLRKEIDKIQNEIELQTETTNLALLEMLKNNVGLSEISGNGVEILLEDSPMAIRAGANATDENLVQASDIRDIVNILNAANAEAISVNKQRIIATSPISSVGTTILVNNSYIAPPLTISAVGDVELMIQRLLNDKSLSSLYDRAKKNKLVFQISVKDGLVIPIYNGDLRKNFLNLIE